MDAVVQSYLYSSFPEPSSDELVGLVRHLVKNQTDPLVAYLPAGNIKRHFVREIKGLLRGVAEVRAIKPEVHNLKRVHTILDRAAMLLIPGGNTYLMAHRLHQIGIVAELRRSVMEGLPLMTFSAGTVFCGRNILTTNDINCCGCTQFEGLGLALFNFNVHYPSSPGDAQMERNERMTEFQQFYQYPVLMLEDGACIRLGDGQMEVVAGQVWMFSGGVKEKCTHLHWQLDTGMQIATS